MVCNEIVMSWDWLRCGCDGLQCDCGVVTMWLIWIAVVFMRL